MSTSKQYTAQPDNAQASIEMSPNDHFEMYLKCIIEETLSDRTPSPSSEDIDHLVKSFAHDYIDSWVDFRALERMVHQDWKAMRENVA